MHKFIANYFKEYRIAHEIRFFRKKIDFIYIDDYNKIHAIELKVKDWKSAIIQSDSNQLFANFCYLGIWHLYVKNVSIQLLEKYGLGLISINKDDIKILLKPKESSIIQEKFTEKIKKQVIEGYL